MIEDKKFVTALVYNTKEPVKGLIVHECELVFKYMSTVEIRDNITKLRKKHNLP